MIVLSTLISHREKLQGDKAMANGLDDVVAAETVLSDVDGLGGRLT
ncbi:MAG: citrate synthase/methylcitrate synthase, partial [Mesorhizobium sp.]